MLRKGKTIENPRGRATNTMKGYYSRLPIRPKPKRIVSHATDTNTNSPPNTRANTDTNEPLTQFHPFPGLPLELKRMVYDYMMPGPRIIQVNFNTHGSRKGDHKFTSNDNYNLPVVLHISRVTREIGLEYFTINAFPHRRAATWSFFDFQNDTLYFDDHGTHAQRISFIENLVKKEVLWKVKKLAFGFFELMREIEIPYPATKIPLNPCLVHFEALEKVVVHFTLEHRKCCSQCGGGQMTLSEGEILDEGKMVARDLKDTLVKGNRYPFQFGVFWKGPKKWVFLTHCTKSDWKEPYLEEQREAYVRPKSDLEVPNGEKGVSGSETSGSSKRAMSEGAVESDETESSLDGVKGEAPPTSPESDYLESPLERSTEDEVKS